MPPHLHYVEPYFGGGAVLLARDPERDWLIDNEWKLRNGEKVPAHLKGCSEVVNDLNGELMNFWIMLRGDQFGKLQEVIEATPFSESQWEHIGEAARDYAAGHMPEAFSNPLTRAWWFFVRYRQSRQGLGKDFATLSRNRTRGRRNEQVNAWLTCVDGLPEIHERLRGVVILNDDAIKVIEQQDGKYTLFYCDPTYLEKTRSSHGEYGDYEMRPGDHAACLGVKGIGDGPYIPLDDLPPFCETNTQLGLLDVLVNVEGKFMLSGYHSECYDTWAARYGFRCHERMIDNKASSAKEKPKRVECVWCNYS